MNTDDRKSTLRRTLVTRASAANTTTRRPWRLGTLVAAVAIGGALTGAASATAISLAAPYEDDVVTTLALSVARANSVAIGAPHYVASEGAVTVGLGAVPAQATGLAVRTSCTEPGSVEMMLDGKWIGSFSCDEETPVSGGGWVESISAGGQHILTFDSTTGTGYEAWISWVKEPPMPTSSAQQTDEMADGAATRDEYVAAFNRFVGCMGAAGYDLGGVSDAVVFQYAVPDAAVQSGADELCYVSQFQDVDAAWQLQNEATSESTHYLHDCLVAKSIVPSANYQDYWAQLQDAGFGVEDCG